MKKKVIIKKIKLSNTIEETSKVDDLTVLYSDDKSVKFFFNELKNQHTEKELLPYSPLCCRFTDIPCPKETHVKCREESDKIYLHANHVNLENRHFIATQYPMIYEALDLKLCESFWKMSKNSSLIVDLTNDNDQKKGLESYAPMELEDALEFGNLYIECVTKNSIQGINATSYTYEIEEGVNEGKNFNVNRIHFKEWTDHQGMSVEKFDRLVDLINHAHKNLSNPVVIHCRAGVGRTGTLIVACAMKPKIMNGEITSENLKQKLTGFILQGRSQRGKHFVQTPEQLRTLIEWAQHILEQVEQKS